VIVIAGVSSRKGLSALTVSYDEAVTGSASSAALYHVFAGVKKVVKKRKETLFTKPLAIASVTPGSTPRAVTINLGKPYKGEVQVMVAGTVTAQNGGSSNIDTAIDVNG
jgi:hypothetical protein